MGELKSVVFLPTGPGLVNDKPPADVAAVKQPAKGFFAGLAESFSEVYSGEGNRRTGFGGAGSRRGGSGSSTGGISGKKCRCFGKKSGR